MIPKIVREIYKHVLLKDGSIADIQTFVNKWYWSDLIRDMSIGTDWSEMISFWPENVVAMFLYRYLNRNTK